MENRTVSNRYRILQQLGEGGFGQTYLAEDLHLPTRPRCVVKKLDPHSRDEESVALAGRLFEQEAEVLYRLGDHPNIPKLLAHFGEAGEFYLVQELIEGYTLAQEFEGGKKFSEREAADALLQILETLAFVHSQNVIHRDIKPSNLIRRYADGKIFLIDFGAVKQVGLNQNQAPTFHSTVAVGSAGYMPSEQLAGKPRFSSDLYALGLVMIEGLTGIHPSQLNQNHNTGEFLWQHKTRLRPELANFISRLVRYDFRQRYNSAAEAFASLNMIARSDVGLSPKAPLAVGAVQPPPQQQQQQIVFAPAAATPVYFPQPQAMPPPAPPRQQQQYSPSIATKQAFHPSPLPPPPPTIVVPVKKKEEPAPKGVLGWLWNNDLALGAFVTVAVFGAFFVGGFLLVRSLAGGGKAQPIASSDVPNNPSSPAPEIQTPSAAYQEAEIQAREAQAKERRATTKHEWEEIGNGYKRAYTLLGAVDSTSPDYREAQAKIALYKQKSEEAYQRIAGAAETSKLSENSGAAQPQPYPSPTPAVSSSSYQYPTPTPSPPLPKLTMPPKQSHRTYLSYNLLNYSGLQSKTITTEDAIFTTRVEGRSDNTRDSDVVSVRINGGGYASASLELKPVHGMRLGVGNYPNAQQYLWQSPTMPAISFDKLHCTDAARHSFTVYAISYDEITGRSLKFLDATFSINCGPNRAMGRIRYDAR